MPNYRLVPTPTGIERRDVSMMRITDLPANKSFVLRNATVPVCLVDNPPADLPLNSDGLAKLDIRVDGGRIASIASPGRPERDITSFDLSEGMVWPCFADVHTHIDKGHIWPRKQNPDGTRPGALSSTGADRAENWTADDVIPNNPLLYLPWYLGSISK